MTEGQIKVVRFCKPPDNPLCIHDRKEGISANFDSQGARDHFFELLNFAFPYTDSDEYDGDEL